MLVLHRRLYRLPLKCPKNPSFESKLQDASQNGLRKNKMDTECMCPVMEKPQLFCGRVFCLIRGFSKGIYGITGLISLFFLEPFITRGLSIISHPVRGNTHCWQIRYGNASELVRIQLGMMRSPWDKIFNSLQAIWLEVPSEQHRLRNQDVIHTAKMGVTIGRFLRPSNLFCDRQRACFV